MKVNGESGDYLVNSLHAKVENNSKLNLSVDKKGRDFRGSTYSNPSNSMYATRGVENNLEPRYENEGSRKNYGQIGGGYRFKNIGNSERMINSVISRESDGQGNSGYRGMNNLQVHMASSKGSSEHNLSSSVHQRMSASGY